MKKRILALLLAVCIAASMLVLPASAAATNNTAVQMAITLGAMDTDQTGALNAVVTRGAFARMLTSFSTFRESVGAQGTVGTLYTDVPGTSPWAPYIRIAVQQGWLNGYTDGSYRPDNAVTLEEACTAVLKLMGYKMTELNGAFPNAQLNKASEIGLRTGLDRKQGEAMNYEDAAVLLYNALTANTASGGAYGTTLGFTVSNGQVDASTVLLSSLQGPFIYGEGAQVPFTPVTVYRNDKVSPSGELNQYDVYYYSESLRTVWVYTRRAAGRITAVSPSASAPTSVTVALAQMRPPLAVKALRTKPWTFTEWPFSNRPMGSGVTMETCLPCFISQMAESTARALLPSTTTSGPHSSDIMPLKSTTGVASVPVSDTPGSAAPHARTT